ncbi:hypothetical protein BHE74_00057778 [Ensete ventricosum]|nr:hypothetical protein BHE74_00057778 [Ensete ventricosum]
MCWQMSPAKGVANRLCKGGQPTMQGRPITCCSRSSQVTHDQLLVSVAAVELLTINEKLNADLDKAGLQLDTSDKELNDTHNLLIDSQKQIKDLLARGQKTNDDLLEAIRELDALRAELPCKAVEEYKEMAWFKLGLRQIGQVSYKYGY